VFAVPGSPLDPRAAGTNDLIKQGATLVTEASDIIHAITPIMERPLRPAFRESEDEPLAPDPQADERDRIVGLLRPAPVSIDDLIRMADTSAAIVRTVLALGESLGIPVLAEGIETEAQWQFLANAGCAKGQGYLFALPVALAPVDDIHFVGRETELAALEQAWEVAKRGSRRVVLVAGEPGIGKTSLVGELAVEAHREGGIVLYGRCDEDVGFAFQPFVEALRAYVASCPPELVRAQVGRGAAELARVLPELAELVPDATPPARPDAALDQYLMFEAVIGFLAGVSRSAPLLLVLDDLAVLAAGGLLALSRGAAAPGLHRGRPARRDATPVARCCPVMWRRGAVGRLRWAASRQPAGDGDPARRAGPRTCCPTPREPRCRPRRPDRCAARRRGRPAAGPIRPARRTRCPASLPPRRRRSR